MLYTKSTLPLYHIITYYFVRKINVCIDFIWKYNFIEYEYGKLCPINLVKIEIF